MTDTLSRRSTVQLGNDFRVSILMHHEKKFEISLLSGSLAIERNIGIDTWEIDYDTMGEIFDIPDVVYVESPMEVYGTMQTIYTYLKDEYPSLMKNVDGWY